MRASSAPALRARPHGPARVCRRRPLIGARRPSAGAGLLAPQRPLGAHPRPPLRARAAPPARELRSSRALSREPPLLPSPPHAGALPPAPPRQAAQDAVEPAQTLSAPGRDETVHRQRHGQRHRQRHGQRHGTSNGTGTGNGTGNLTPRGARPSSADVSGPCPDASLQPNEANLERVRAAVVCLVNRERTAHGEGPLQANDRLEQAAQSHTESMAFGNYFDHVGPGGDTPLSRMRASGYLYSSRIGFEVGENIGWGTLWEGTPGAVVAAWMASTGHRENILDARFRDTAVGVSPHIPSSMSRGQAGGIYTQDFGVITTG